LPFSPTIPAIATMVSRIPHPYTRADAETFVRAFAKRENGNCVYAITETETGKLFGCCSLETSADGKALELGYWVGEPFWGRGIATEAVHALVAMAFRTRDIEHIDARCRVTNPASRRVLQKSGFQFQGTEHDQCARHQRQRRDGMVPARPQDLDFADKLVERETGPGPGSRRQNLPGPSKSGVPGAA
jgi:RimJ/RimL family protein N-acetyltransferase